MKRLFKSLFVFLIVGALVFGNANGAFAASGGRIGGGSFRMPSRGYSSPRTYAPPGGGYYPAPYPVYPGGGWGLPFVVPLFGFGGGLFSLLIFIAVAGFLMRSFRSFTSTEVEDSAYGSNPSVSVAQVQVGLLASARNLKTELNQIAEAADTNSPQGRTEVLQEASLALLRHPEYWVYAGGTTEQTRLDAAETQFNRLALAERSKFSQETLSNVNNQLKAANPKAALPSTGELDNPTRLFTEGPGEYIVVTLLAATLGKFQIPTINSSDDLRQALRQIGSIPSEKLLAIEVLWTPQAEDDTLTSDDLFAEYADLKVV